MSSTIPSQILANGSGPGSSSSMDNGNEIITHTPSDTALMKQGIRVFFDLEIPRAAKLELEALRQTAPVPNSSTIELRCAMHAAGKAWNMEAASLVNRFLVSNDVSVMRALVTDVVSIPRPLRHLPPPPRDRNAMDMDSDGEDEDTEMSGTQPRTPIQLFTVGLRHLENLSTDFYSPDYCADSYHAHPSPLTSSDLAQSLGLTYPFITTTAALSPAAAENQNSTLYTAATMLRNMRDLARSQLQDVAECFDRRIRVLSIVLERNRVHVFGHWSLDFGDAGLRFRFALLRTFWLTDVERDWEAAREGIGMYVRWIGRVYERWAEAVASHFRRQHLSLERSLNQGVTVDVVMTGCGYSY
ncbi:hypothetical protein BJX99DRAFT_259033 [Aspergillus californicus]